MKVLAHPPALSTAGGLPRTVISATPRSHPLHIGLSGSQIIELSGYFLAAEAGERL
jgi:hypothetical protein